MTQEKETQEAKSKIVDLVTANTERLFDKYYGDPAVVKSFPRFYSHQEFKDTVMALCRVVGCRCYADATLYFMDEINKAGLTMEEVSSYTAKLKLDLMDVPANPPAAH